MKYYQGTVMSLDTFITNHRQTGQTSELVEILKNRSDAILIVHNAEFKNRLAKQYDISAKQIYCLSDAWSHLRGSYMNGPVFIDSSCYPVFVEIISELQNEISKLTDKLEKIASILVK